MRYSEPHSVPSIRSVSKLCFPVQDVVFLAPPLSLTLMVTCETGLRIL